MRIAATGDVMLGRYAGEVLASNPPEYVWGDTLSLLRSADAVLINLECVIASYETGNRWPSKVFYFKAPPAAIEALRAVRVTVATVANNHTLDYGYEALAEMLVFLDQAGIRRAGAGRDADHAREAAAFESADRRVAVIAFTDNEPAWEAGPRRPGVFYVPIDRGDPRAALLFEMVGAARKAYDLVIVSAHWGPNMIAQPLPRHPGFARAVADAGADLFIGHSAHVYQGIELYTSERRHKVVPICYDLGDFVDDYAVDPVLRNDRSFVFQFAADAAGIRRIDLYPVLIEAAGCRVNRATGREAEETMAVMVERCEKMGTAARRSDDAVVIDVPTATP